MFVFLLGRCDLGSLLWVGAGLSWQLGFLDTGQAVLGLPQQGIISGIFGGIFFPGLFILPCFFHPDISTLSHAHGGSGEGVPAIWVLHSAGLPWSGL